jgi:hypothetical protein
VSIRSIILVNNRKAVVDQDHLRLL